MSWKRRIHGKPKQIGLKFKEKTLFFQPKHQYLADIVNLKSVKGAEIATDKLLKTFSEASTRTKKRQIKQATVSAANRAGVGGKNPNLSEKQRVEYKGIQALYERAQKAMVLPPKTGADVFGKRPIQEYGRLKSKVVVYDASSTVQANFLISELKKRGIKASRKKALINPHLGMGIAVPNTQAKEAIEILKSLGYKRDVYELVLPPSNPVAEIETKKSTSEIARAAARKAWEKRKGKEPKVKSEAPLTIEAKPLTIKTLSGMQLKNDINFKRAIKAYQNKHKDGSGNFGFTLVDKNGKWFNLRGVYDSTGRIWDLDFGPYSAAPSKLTAKVDGKKPLHYTYNSIVNEIKQRAAGRKGELFSPKTETPTVPDKPATGVTQLNGHDQYVHQWEVPSKSRPNKTYKVSKHAEGHYLCDCPAFIFQKGPISHRKPCKHIEEVKAKVPAAKVTQKIPTKVTPAGVYAPPKKWWEWATEQPHGPKRTPLSPAAAGHLWFKVYADEKRLEIIEDPSKWIEGRH